MSVHPNDALFSGEKPFPIIPVCEHFAGNEKMILKAMSFQEKKGPVFDITQDCEDGAQTGQEEDHAKMIVRVTNSSENKLRMAGVRIHDYTNKHWKKDVDILVPGAGENLAYITIPKPTKVEQVEEMITYIQDSANRAGIKREIPIHVLVETHGALRDAEKIAALPWMQVLDFGLMDFISGYHGAIPMSNMKSPGQFDHKVLAFSKSRVVNAAISNGVVPAHNVTLDLKNFSQTLQDAHRARYDFGFLRMWSIYPTQIDAIVEAMKPDLNEVGKAINVLQAAQDAAWGPIQFDGELHDRATYRGFWTLVQQARFAGHKLSDEANKRWFN